ncbi:hypothetical protein HY095_02580 [Candidatus Micrarchaeota archaeon]|nr:hypothetical protein [Candidatus Micrarchaeota archaeon]
MNFHIPGIAKFANGIRRRNEKLLAILPKLSSKTGGFNSLNKYGLTDEEIKLMKEELPDGKLDSAL